MFKPKPHLHCNLYKYLQSMSCFLTKTLFKLHCLNFSNEMKENCQLQADSCMSEMTEIFLKKWHVVRLFICIEGIFPPLPDRSRHQTPEQNSLLSASHVSADGSLAATGQQRLETQKMRPCCKHQLAWDALWSRWKGEKKKRPEDVVEIALCLHLFLQYLFTFRAVSLQQGN